MGSFASLNAFALVHCDSLTPKGVDLILQPPHQKQPPSSCTHSIEYAVSWSIAVASVENQIWLRWSILKIRFWKSFHQIVSDEMGIMEFHGISVSLKTPRDIDHCAMRQRTGLRPVPQNMRQPVVLGSAQLRIRAVGQSLSSALARPQLLSLKSQDISRQ